MRAAEHRAPREGSALLANAEAFSAPVEQAETLKQAAKAGTPFCAICNQ